ncbi:MAG: hypothetical protein AVDCRST_MAG49-2233, partial [uncultured Thermomicrobiales bacterium]
GQADRCRTPAPPAARPCPAGAAALQLRARRAASGDRAEGVRRGRLLRARQRHRRGGRGRRRRRRRLLRAASGREDQAPGQRARLAQRGPAGPERDQPAAAPRQAGADRGGAGRPLRHWHGRAARLLVVRRVAHLPPGCAGPRRRPDRGGPGTEAARRRAPGGRVRPPGGSRPGRGHPRRGRHLRREHPPARRRPVRQFDAPDL